jgi:glycosyltransferase involved in cell wall biosynthesis
MNGKFPLISVVIPTYNRSSLIVKSNESVFSQDYPNLEVIVVDDGSTDGTQQVIEGLKNPNIRYFRHEQNRGQDIPPLLTCQGQDNWTSFRRPGSA